MDDYPTLSMAYKGMVYKGGFWAVLKILGKLRVSSTQAFQLRVFQRVMSPKSTLKNLIKMEAMCSFWKSEFELYGYIMDSVVVGIHPLLRICPCASITRAMLTYAI